MKNYLLILSLFSMALSAQINRFVYEYKYIPILEKKDSVITEMMVLDITEQKSIYQSLGKVQQDSTMKAEVEKAMTQGGMNFNFTSKGNLLKSTTSYKVSKEYPNYDVFLHERFSTDSYKVKEDEKINWKIFPETQQFGEYKGQKATTEFGGRSWIAWFSTDIPFLDGPYKFYGLPGLIVHIEDASQTHIMSLVANKKIKSTSDDKEISASGGVKLITSFGQEISVSEKQFKKVHEEYLNDPSKGLKQLLLGSGGDPNVKTEIKMVMNGKEISNNQEILRALNKESKNKAPLNRIEPSLYNK